MSRASLSSLRAFTWHPRGILHSFTLVVMQWEPKQRVLVFMFSLHQLPALW
jgi:hypothetical protein